MTPCTRSHASLSSAWCQEPQQDLHYVPTNDLLAFWLKRRRSRNTERQTRPVCGGNSDKWPQACPARSNYTWQRFYCCSCYFLTTLKSGYGQRRGILIQLFSSETPQEHCGTSEKNTRTVPKHVRAALPTLPGTHTHSFGLSNR